MRQRHFPVICVLSEFILLSRTFGITVSEIRDCAPHVLRSHANCEGIARSYYASTVYLRHRCNLPAGIILTPPVRIFWRKGVKRCGWYDLRPLSSLYVALSKPGILVYPISPQVSMMHDSITVARVRAASTHKKSNSYALLYVKYILLFTST